MFSTFLSTHIAIKRISEKNKNVVEPDATELEVDDTVVKFKQENPVESKEAQQPASSEEVAQTKDIDESLHWLVQSIQLF